MSDEIRKLLAGYATGTLTEAERQVLFDAALVDDELFTTLADEEPLRELLTEPAARAELLARIEPAPAGFRERFAAWLRRPAVTAGFAAAAFAVVVISVIPLFRNRVVAPPSAVARLNTNSPAPQITATAKTPKDLARQDPVRKRVEGAVMPKTAPAAPAAPKEDRPPAAAPAQMVLSDRFPVAQRGAAGDGPAASLVPPQTSPASPASPALAPRAREAPEAPADVARFVAASKATGRASIPPRIAIVRKAASGEYSEADPSQTVFSPGEMVRLRIEPAESGLLKIEGATPQPIVQPLTNNRVFETGDILVGNADMRLMISFSTEFPVVRTMTNSMRSSERAEANPRRPVEVILRVKRP